MSELLISLIIVLIGAFVFIYFIKDESNKKPQENIIWIDMNSNQEIKK